MAIGCIQVLEEAGIRVPLDVAVIGYDDNHFASESSVPISSVAKHGREMGEHAMRLLVARLEDREAQPEHVVLTPRLVARESSQGISAEPYSPDSGGLRRSLDSERVARGLDSRFTHLSDL